MKKAVILAIGLATVAILALSGCGSSGGDDDAPSYTAYPYDTPPASEALKAEVLHAVNMARSVDQNCGEYGIMPATTPLGWSNELYSSAYEHSEDMATANYFSHTGSGTNSDWTAQVQELGGSSTSGARIKNNGWVSSSTEYGASGENIYAHAGSTVNEAVSAWLASPGHCQNLMAPDYKYIGMARVDNGASDFHTYWTQNFGS